MSLSNRFANRQYQRYFVDLQALYQRKEVVVYTGLTLSLFTIAFFGIFALKPTLTTIVGLYREIEDKKVVNQQLQDKINDLRDAQNNYAQVAGSVYVINQALPENPSLVDLVYQIEILGQNEGLSLASVNFSPVDLQGKAPNRKSDSKIYNGTEINFDVTLKGDYQNLKNFLDATEKLRRLIIVDSFSFNQTQTEEVTFLTLNLTGKAFYYDIPN
ncbi:MAG: type 4a pilus biogenesis protein PilO [bacterium]|nr:type 4a pilus biogenesis protein PilO [bacterium]